MPKSKLSAQAVEKARPPASGRIEIWDTLVPGLGVRITDRGSKSWVVMYRVGHRQRRLTFGRYPALSLADAREMARDALNRVAKGFDPASEKQAARQVTPAPTPKSIEWLGHEFIERYAKPKNRSWKETERIFKRYINPVWGHRHADEITRHDVIALTDRIIDNGTPYMAKRVRAATSTFFNWCISKAVLDSSPATGIPVPFAEVARDRILNDDEIRAVWASWEKMGWPFGTAFKLILVTGQRRSEVCGMRWSNVDLEKQLWTLPREATKSDRLHEVPLSTLAMGILETVRRNGDYIFSTNGTTPISGFSQAKRRCDALAGVDGWRLHDLRRTAASGMARLGVSPHVVEKILNHATGTISGVAAVYNRHGYLDEKRDALDSWSRVIDRLVQVTPEDLMLKGWTATR